MSRIISLPFCETSRSVSRSQHSAEQSLTCQVRSAGHRCDIIYGQTIYTESVQYTCDKASRGLFAESELRNMVHYVDAVQNP